MEFDLSKVRVGGNPLKQTENSFQFDISKVRLSTQRVSNDFETYDVNNDSTVDLKDLVAEKKKERNGELLPEYKNNAQQIRTYLLSPSARYSSKVNSAIDKLNNNELTAADRKETLDLLSKAKDDETLTEEERTYYRQLYNSFGHSGNTSYENLRSNSDYEQVLRDSIYVSNKHLIATGKKALDLPTATNVNSLQAVQNFKNRQETSKNPTNGQKISQAEESNVDFETLKESATAYIKDADNFARLTGHSRASYLNDYNGYTDSSKADTRLDEMTADEAALLIYISETQGQEEAWNYLLELKDDLGGRKQIEAINEMRDTYERSTDLEKVALNAYSVLTNVFESPLSALDMAKQYAVKGEFDAYTDMQVNTTANQSIRQLTAEDIESNVQIPVLKDLAAQTYQGFMSGADMLLGSLTLGAFGKYGYTASMSLGAGAGKARDLYARGASQSQIALGAVASAGIEFFIERGIADSFDNAVTKRAVSELVKQMLGEGKEEVLSNIGDMVIESVVMGKNSASATEVRRLMQEEGLSESEAVLTVTKNKAKEIFWDFYGGAISAGIMGAPSVAAYGISNSSYGKNIVKKNNTNSLIEIALMLPEDTDAHQIAESIKGKNGNVSNSRIGELFSATASYISESEVSVVSSAVENELNKLGITNSADVAQTIVAMAKMEDVEQSAKDRVLGDNRSKKVYLVLIGDSYNSLEQSDSIMRQEARNITSAWVSSLGSRAIKYQTANALVNQMLSAEAKENIVESFAALTENGKAFVADESNSNRITLSDKMSLRAIENKKKKNSQLQSSANGGIITSNKATDLRGDDNVRYEKRGLGQKSGINARGEGKISQIRTKIEEYVARGNAEVIEVESGRGRRLVKVNYKNSNVTFTEGKAEDTSGYHAYIAFCNAGIDAIYCDGEITRNVGGEDIVRTDAFTAPDGTVYISSLCKLTDKEIYDHEKVHSADFTNNKFCYEYKVSLLEEIVRTSETYRNIAKQINDNQFGGKYDIEDTNFFSIFIREIAAYINQYVLSDPEYAEQKFGGMFKDWGAVVEAVNKFNTDMGADFSESASFMPENDKRNDTQVVPYDETENEEDGLPRSARNDNREDGTAETAPVPTNLDDVLDDESNSESEVVEERPVFRSPSAREIDRPPTLQESYDTMLGRGENINQRHIKDVAQKLGVGVRWSTDCLEGYYDPATNTIVMNPTWSLTEQYYVLFKHEFVHYLETKRGYADFKDYLINHSVAFEDYVRTQLKAKNGTEFTGNREQALEAYTEIVLKERRAAKGIPDRIKKGYTAEKIHREIIADFVGNCLLGQTDIKKSEQALLELAQMHRNIFQKFWDWVKERISLLKGEPRNRTLAEDLEYLNQRLARVWDSAQKRSAKKGERQYSVNNKKITPDMSDSERSEILKNKSIKNIAVVKELPSDIAEKFADVSVWDDINKLFGKNKSNLIKKIASEFEVFKKYENLDINLEFEFSNNNFHESYHKQKNNYEQFCKMFSVFDGVIENAVGVEIHRRENYKPDPTLENVYVLISAFEDGELIIPVKLEIKEFKDKQNTLYVAISLEGIKKAEVSEQGTTENGVAQNSRSAIISIYDLVSKINPKDTNFLKYIPNQLLNENQIAAKNKAENIEVSTDKRQFSSLSSVFAEKMERLTADVKAGELSVDEFVKQVNELAANEHKVSEDMKKAFDEQSKKHEDFVIDSAKYMAQQKKRIKRQNEQLAKRRSELSAEITAQREERATKQKNIEHIRKTVSRIDKMFRANTDTKHIPEDLKELSAYFVKIFVDNDTSTFDKRDLRDIRTLYNDLIGDYNIFTGDGETAVSGFDLDVINDLKALEKHLNGKTLRDLEYYDTLLIRNIVDNFAQIIKNENEMFVAGKQYEIDEIGNKALKEVIAEKSKSENGVIKAIDKYIKYSNMTPIYFFERLGGTFKALFDDILNGQNVWYRNVENAKTYIRQIKEKYNYSEWTNDSFELITEKGDKIKITREQALLLYATAKREYGNKFQRAEHLFRGGVVLPPSTNTVKDIIKKYRVSDKKGIAKINDAITEEINSRAHRIMPEDVSKIMDWLTDEQRDYADAFVEYLSKDMAALGNEVSMQLFGINKFNEDYYIPYNSAQNYLYSQPGVTNDSRLKHQSFTKNTVVGANNPLVLSDFSEVCADHINRMCMYNALTVPLENMNKIFNYHTASTEDKDGKDVKVEIERVYGASAVKYIKQFLTDMNGNVRISETDKAINRWISRFKKGAVFTSASVVVQQPSAVMRAMAYVDPKYFRKTTLKFAERDYQQAVHYAPVAGIKEMGRFDTGIGAATTNWLLQETPKGLKNKGKALFSLKDSTYRDDKLSYAAAKADEITWAHIWAAVKAEIADTTDLKVDSEEYFTACGERFTEVINYTQVYDSTISRSQIMRDKSAGAQMVTAFMSEPTVSLNLLMNAVHNAKTGGKAGAKFAARAIGAFVGSVILNAALKSLVTAGRDDDEDKTYWEKYREAFFESVASDINPLGLIPFVKDVISIFEGYTVERADMNLFSDLAQSIQILQNDNKTPYQKIESIAGSLSAFLGVPTKNILRDTRAAYNTYKDLFVNDTENRAVNKEIKEYMDELEDNQTFDSLDEEDKQKLEKNITNTVQKVNKAQDNKKALKDFDELYELLRNNKTAYSKKRKELIKDGTYTSKEITDGVEIARIAYMKSIGIDVGEYLLYKIAVSKNYADKDGDEYVSAEEKKEAINSLDFDSKTKNYFKNSHK